jgi:hypothetical protein
VTPPPPTSMQRKPDWAELEHLVEGARQRGYSEAQLEYLRSCIGLAWAKGAFAAEERLKVSA